MLFVYNKTMVNNNTPPKEVLSVRGLVARRMEQLEDSKRILTMGQSDYKLTLKSFSDSVASFSEMAQSSEGKLLKSDIEKLQLTSLQPIPPELASNQESVAMMHNKFRALTGAIFSGDHMPDFFAGIVKQGCDLIAAEANGLISQMNELTAFVKQHANEICGYLDKLNAGNAVDMVTKIVNSAEEITAKSQDMYLQLVKTFNSAKATNGFSDTMLDSVMQQADSLINLFGTDFGKNPAMSSANFRNYESMLTDINYKANSLIDYGTNLPTMADKIENIDINKIYDENFSQILANGNKLISTAKSAINAAENNNAQALVQSVKSIISQATFIKGQLGQLKKRGIKGILQGGGDLVNQFNSLVATAQNFANNFPKEAMRIFQNDINTIMGITNDLAKSVNSLSRKKRPTSQEVAAIAQRLEDKNTQVTLHVGDLIAGVNGFNVPISEPATAAINALKATAPTPMDSLARGNVLTFTKAIDNPAMLTQIGQCQEAIREAMIMPGISAQEFSMLTTLLDYVNGEYERELMTSFISDLDLQTSMAVTGIDKYADEVLSPKLRLLYQYEKLRASKGGQ